MFLRSVFFIGQKKCGGAGFLEGARGSLSFPLSQGRRLGPNPVSLTGCLRACCFAMTSEVDSQLPSQPPLPSVCLALPATGARDRHFLVSAKCGNCARGSVSLRSFPLPSGTRPRAASRPHEHHDTPGARLAFVHPRDQQCAHPVCGRVDCPPSTWQRCRVPGAGIGCRLSLLCTRLRRSSCPRWRGNWGSERAQWPADGARTFRWSLLRIRFSCEFHGADGVRLCEAIPTTVFVVCGSHECHRHMLISCPPPSLPPLPSRRRKTKPIGM